MKTFMAVYLGTPENMQKWTGLDDVERKEKERLGMEAWAAWGNTYREKIVSNGAPLGKTKLVNKKGIKDSKNEMAAYTIVQAESHEEAAKMFLDHPHFAIFPGDRVEIMECLPIPKMSP